jgi:peptide/nickel transport system permease protein
LNAIHASSQTATQTQPSQRETPVQPARFERFAHRITTKLWIGFILTAIWIGLTILTPLFTRYPPDLVIAEAKLQPPSTAHPFGTDPLGRDMLSRTLYGSRVALVSAITGAGTAAVAGTLLGLIAGYTGGLLDRILSRAIEIGLGVPPLLLALIIVARLGPSLRNTIIALGIISIPSFFRISRSRVISIRQAPYTEAARAFGAGPVWIMAYHLLPNIAPSLIVLTTMRMGRFILAGGALTFIGLGAQPPKPEWGALLATGRDYLASAPWLAAFPGAATMLAVVSLNLLGEGLRDLMDVSGD